MGKGQYDFSGRRAGYHSNFAFMKGGQKTDVQFVAVHISNMHCMRIVRECSKPNYWLIDWLTDRLTDRRWTNINIEQTFTFVCILFFIGPSIYPHYIIHWFFYQFIEEPVKTSKWLENVTLKQCCYIVLVVTILTFFFFTPTYFSTLTLKVTWAASWWWYY